MDLKEFINSANISLYMKELPVEDSVDLALFPVKKQMGTEITLAKGAKNKPVALRMSTLDAAAKVRALNASLNLEKKELPFFKEAIGINETTRRELVNAANSNNQNLIEALSIQVFENYENLIKGADIQAKRMRTSLIQNGLINITTDDGDIVVDYGVPDDHKETISEAAKKWNVATADIVGDIKRYQKAITDDNYTKPTILLCTETTFDNTFVINTAIINHLKGGESTKNMILSQQDFINFAKERLGISIVFLEENTYIPTLNGTPQAYYENGRVTLISGSTLGNTVYGATPEEWDKIYGSGKLDTSLVRNVIAVTCMTKEDPVTVDTKVSEMVLPSFERADECFFAKVY